MRIKAAASSETVINKSRFICYLQRTDSEQQAKDYIKIIKKLHPKATHHCHAYIINSLIQRSNDDNEPAGTAGIPMLEVLRQRKMDCICAVVVRYFGGILLGSGGLIRAYSNSVANALDQAECYEVRCCPVYRFTIDYHFTGKVEYLLTECTVLDKAYQEQVTYTFMSDDPLIAERLAELTGGLYHAEHLEDREIEKIIR
ncbi:MAG: YigZ family protein [Erysipelotrichaceae bacterium]|nr:YigZ family protein [Erysipelotrichaceae bacterium]